MATNKPTILYADDDESMRELTECFLEEHFHVLSCESGADALRQAPTAAPALILLDVMMPDMDGPATLLRLRNFGHLATVPAVFMTGTTRPTDVAALIAAGAVDVIAKPLDPDTLVDRLHRAIASVESDQTSS